MADDEIEEWTPAFPGQRPPFRKGNEYRLQPGHKLSMKHGATSPRTVEALVREIFLPRIEKELSDPDTGTVRVTSWSQGQDLATVEAQIHLLTTHMNQVGMLDQEHNPRPFNRLLETLRERRERLRRELGLSPMAQARIAEATGIMPGEGGDWRDYQRRLRERYGG